MIRLVGYDLQDDKICPEDAWNKYKQEVSTQVIIIISNIRRQSANTRVLNLGVIYQLASGVSLPYNNLRSSQNTFEEMTE